jgi:hypothetical protein
VGLSCTSATGSSASETDVATGAASVTLGAGDTVTCTYTNAYERRPSGLAIRKVALGGAGTFRYDISGEGEHIGAAVTTDTPGVAALAEPSDRIANLPAGSYRIDEELPPDVGGQVVVRARQLPATAGRTPQ